ncbi:hypothetical protein QBC47DRAFT_409639 [Echria macrotheca]|uniref:Fungal lipase-like domain-containing protein n=1 Tax=Echria macrotheca TaxID=438768 RepID=A0AAJ0FF44_9PEZI|nr:hypothetical protein QBC47DRAFT_409639 [Echria macrotheca]
MPTNPNFAPDYIHLGKEGTMSDNKKLTFIAASALSLLCYEKEDQISRILRTDDRFRVARDLDLLSNVWVIPNFADSTLLQKQSSLHSSPLLAWSLALQTVFVGFRGTWSAYDVLSDIDIRQSPDPTLGSRFHAGFYARASQYTTLIEQLAKRYRVVVCGHSLGGAMATLATYLVLGKDTNLHKIANAWENVHNGLSVVTFGSPAAMVVEEQSSTAALQKRWGTHFHHIINPDDPIPFALGESPKWFAKFFAVASRAALPPQFQLVLWVLKFWLENLSRGSFAHYGCIYLVEMADQIIQCRQITAISQIPQKAPDGSKFRQYHSMDHYAHCLGTTAQGAILVSPMGYTASMTADQFCQQCWQLPAAIRECSGVVHDNQVTISATVESRLVQFFLKDVMFKRNGKNVCVGSISFALNPDNHDQMFMRLDYDLGPDHTPAESLEVLHSIRTSLYAYDMFGHATRLPVSEVRNQSLRHASVPGTLDSLHLAMIIAFADQIAWVQKLKLERDAGGDEDANPAVLTERAAEVADLVDNIVISAPPHLVSRRLKYALETSESLWPESREEPPAPRGPGNPCQPDCPAGPKAMVNDMLEIFIETALHFQGTSVDNWKTIGRLKLAEVMPNTSLTVALKNFSDGFYNRPTDPEERIQHAIRQADDVLSSMRFCHVIMLTQLDAPPDWYWEVTTGTLAKSIGIVAGASLLGAGTVIGIGVMAVSLAYSWMQQPVELLKIPESRLKLTLEVLGVEASPLGSIAEMQLAAHLETDMGVSDSMETLERWQKRLAEGLKKHPVIKGRIDPSLFWAKWLFNVARVGKLRALIASQIRIGVEGPSEAGKSELLTALTGADPNTFRSGSHTNCRTMEIQIHRDTEREAAFVDCPGADDRNPRIREMAGLFRGMFGILLFVVPLDGTRSTAKEKALKEISMFLRRRGSDLRPVRILLSKADQLPSKRSRDEVFRNSLIESKRTVIRELRRLGSLPKDFVIHSRQARSDGALIASETLEDIVHPFSTHAQMSDDGKRALSDCPADEARKIDRLSLFHSLYRMAEEGYLWDIESLREWLRELSPNSVPDSARVWQDGVARRIMGGIGRSFKLTGDRRA